MSRFLFVRHGETDWNRQGLIQGSRDIPLNQTGFSQAFIAARALKDFPITKIVTSPQLRARDTAEIICQHFSPDILCIEPDLRERCFGDYEGRDLEGVERTPIKPNQPNGPFDYPGSNVEPFSALRMRAKTAVNRWIGGNDSDLILFVAHGGIFSALHHEMECGVYRKIGNAIPYEFARGQDGAWGCRPLRGKP
jgi:broad specificity phosphatase PhoE